MGDSLAPRLLIGLSFIAATSGRLGKVRLDKRPDVNLACIDQLAEGICIPFTASKPKSVDGIRLVDSVGCIFLYRDRFVLNSESRRRQVRQEVASTCIPVHYEG